ncbi:hypothetical protein O181_130296, partial [Austropuccinia psidii MF-1]|nr:hypothetical protein [Austropuccinia psidii MF-1]
MFESISLASLNVISPKLCFAPSKNDTNPSGLEQGGNECIASCLSKLKQHATQLSIERGRAEKELLMNPHKNLEELMGTFSPDDCIKH